MANQLYPTGDVAIKTGDIDLNSDTIRIALLGAGYTFDEAHEFFDDVTDVLGTPMALTGNTVLADGFFDANDVTYLDVGPSDTVEYVVLYKWTGTAGTSRLIAFMDTNDDTTDIERDGDGGPIYIKWPTGGIFN